MISAISLRVFPEQNSKSPTRRFHTRRDDNCTKVISPEMYSVSVSSPRKVEGEDTKK